MNFEDMQVIWDSQNEQPLYGVNEAGLRAILRDKGRKFGRFVIWQLIQTYGATLFVFAWILTILLTNYARFELLGNSVELTVWEIVALFVAAGLWVPHTLGTYVERKRQRYRDRVSASSLQDELDRDIELMEAQIRSRKKLPMAYIPPYGGMALVLLVWVRIAGLTEWLIVPIIIILIAILIWESRHQQRLVTRKMLPRKRELESLREKLTDPKR